MVEKQLCGATISVDCCTDFECELAPGHAGDHQLTFMWENEPYGPKLPPKPLTPQQQARQEWAMAMYGKMIERVLKPTPLVLGAEYAPYITVD